MSSSRVMKFKYWSNTYKKTDHWSDIPNRHTWHGSKIKDCSSFYYWPSDMIKSMLKQKTKKRCVKSYGEGAGTKTMNPRGQEQRPQQQFSDLNGGWPWLSGWWRLQSRQRWLCPPAYSWRWPRWSSGSRSHGAGSAGPGGETINMQMWNSDFCWGF